MLNSVSFKASICSVAVLRMVKSVLTLAQFSMQYKYKLINSIVCMGIFVRTNGIIIVIVKVRTNRGVKNAWQLSNESNEDDTAFLFYD